MRKPSDEYCTPAWLADRLGQFNTDPCSNSHSNISALIRYGLEWDRNGLKKPWFGRIWLNPPYSNPLPWMEKLITEPGMTEALVLVKLDPSTKWWKVLTSRPHDLWLFKKRIQFEGINPTSSNNFCSALIHLRDIPGLQPQLDLHDVANLYAQKP